MGNSSRRWCRGDERDSYGSGVEYGYGWCSNRRFFWNWKRKRKRERERERRGRINVQVGGCDAMRCVERVVQKHAKSRNE
jgi:hypothetical protein